MMLKLRRVISLWLILALLTLGAGLAEQDLQLPGALQVVSEEAFAGDTDIRRVTLPEGVTEIQKRAFASSGVTEINLPSTLTFIAEDAFADTPLSSVSAVEGTYAYNWAVDHGYIAAPVPSALTATVSASTASTTVGEVVTWTVKASGGTGNCRYTFRLYKDNSLVVEENRGTSNTFSYSLDVAGAYYVACDVADDRIEIGVSGGSVTVTNRASALSGEITCDKTSASVGDTVNWTVHPEGGSGKYSYTYLIYRNNAKIYTSPAIDDNVLTYQFDKAATYYLTCKLSDGSKTVTLTSAKIVVTKAESGTGFSINVQTDSDALSTTDSQVWTVTPSGGKAPYRYSYTLKQGTTTVETQAYGTDSSFGHTFFKAGSYTLNIKVKDSSGAVVSEDYPFTVSRGATAVTGVVRIYVDTDSFGNVVESTGKTGHFELQLNNDSGDGIYFDNKRFDNPVFSFGSAGGGAITVFGAEEVSRHNARLYTFSFNTTADKVDQLLHSVMPSQYLNINSESENDIGYLYSSKKSYVIKSSNCFTTVAAWCTVLGYTQLSQIVTDSKSYTDYIGWKMYNQYGAGWDYVGDF